MKTVIDKSWYKITDDELKNRKYMKRNISALIKEAGYKERPKTKLVFLPRIKTGETLEKSGENTSKYINYLHTNYRKKPKSNKRKNKKKENDINVKKPEEKNEKEKIIKVYKRNINKTEIKNQDEICFYCLSYLEEPVILECSHKICKNCLDEMIMFEKFIKSNDENKENKSKKSSEVFGLSDW